MADKKLLLEGLQVLDVGTWVFGPASTTVMSDFGADVTKIENPSIGDPYRSLYVLPPMPVSDVDYNWLLDGRNKKSVALNLKDDEAREVLYALCRDADVFVTNYPPAVAKDLGIAYEDIAPLNGRLIFAHATGYGEKGPEANKPGYDATAWWARTALMDQVRVHGADPSMTSPAMGDHPSAMTLFGGIMMALYDRERTGKGCKVSSSLMANGAWSNGCLIQAELCGAERFVPRDRLDPINAVVNTYRSRDERWFILALTQEDRDWPRLANALGLAELMEDERFAIKEARRAHAVELAAILDANFKSKGFEELCAALEKHRVTFGVVARIEDVTTDPQMILNDVFVELEDPKGEPVKTIDSPIWISGYEKAAPKRAPEIGEHTGEVLRVLGYDAKTVARLRESGAIR